MSLQANLSPCNSRTADFFPHTDLLVVIWILSCMGSRSCFKGLQTSGYRHSKKATIELQLQQQHNSGLYPIWEHLPLML